MLFNSYLFLFLFLPLAWFSFKALLQKDAEKITPFLFIVSLIFYGFWDWKYFFVLIPSIICNFLLGQIIQKNHKKWLLILGVSINLFALCYYKYFCFLAGILHFDTQNICTISLPLGISFFTFTQITYLVDIYKNKAGTANFFDYSLFVTYFPHLISGPLLHHKDMIQQFCWKHSPSQNHLFYATGLGLLTLGLFKKVILADRLGLIADPIFLNVKDLSLIEAWKGVLAYTFQLYFDFSGYSDMAIGISRLFHIDLPINFNSPYKASNVIDFWRRWHMTLSQFLKDYIYIPLGGSKKGQALKLMNLFIVMFICGIWHGAGYTFIVWGIWHGIFLILNHGWRLINYRSIRIPGLITQTLGWFFTLFIVILGWVVFRAQSLNDAYIIYQSLFFGNINIAAFDKSWLIILCALLLATIGPNTQEIFAYRIKIKTWLQWCPSLFCALILACLLIFAISRIQPVSPFLYWQF